MSKPLLSGQSLIYECMECKSEFFKPMPRGWLGRKLHQWLPMHCSLCQSHLVKLKGAAQR